MIQSNRQMIAEIYEARAEKKHLDAMNGGGRDDISHVVRCLGEAAELEERAKLYRDIEVLGNPIGHRTRQ